MSELEYYAKNLYLKIGDNGKQTETIRSIASKCSEYLEKKRDKKRDKDLEIEAVSRGKVERWIKAYNWKADLADMKRELAQKILEKEKALEDNARANREAILEAGASTIEVGKIKNDKIYDQMHEIFLRKIEATKAFLNGRKWVEKNPEIKITWADVKRCKLDNYQEMALFSKSADKKFDYDKIVADAVIQKMPPIEINFNILNGKDNKNSDKNYDS